MTNMPSTRVRCLAFTNIALQICSRSLVDSLTDFFQGSRKTLQAEAEDQLSDANIYSIRLQSSGDEFTLIRALVVLVATRAIWWLFRILTRKSPLDNIPGPSSPSFISGHLTQFFDRHG
ncbi:unnamed protein product [Somion occarium]|uniref:Uncharacterized protein n=1 Tax=Somion occarium TaxID=3059160 RepID=A0ABP1CPN2_9APHY